MKVYRVTLVPQALHLQLRQALQLAQRSACWAPRDQMQAALQLSWKHKVP